MILKVMGSSSHGNGYALIADNNDTLLIEAGVNVSDMLKAINHNVSAVAGCLLSHEHGDHSAFAEAYANKYRIKIFSSAGTIQTLGDHFPEVTKMMLKQVYNVGPYRVMAFSVKHDATDPVGFLINHPECGTVLFATDTYYLPCTFDGLNNVIIECNYDTDILNNNIEHGRVNPSVRNRIIKSHFSYTNCRAALLSNDLRAVNNIVLIHLSDDNSDARGFKTGISNSTGKTVSIADKGLSINFNKTPF